jgi:hypothetical protein
VKPLTPSPGPLPDPRPDPPPAFLIWLVVVSLVVVVALAASGALGSTLDDTRQRSPLPSPVYTVLAPVTVAP